MDAETLRWTLITVVVGALFMWGLTSLLFRVSGTWERVLTDEEIAKGARRERVSLGQMGPLVMGRRDVPGGYQELSGFLVGRTLYLKRRDHGLAALRAQGFPEPVAKLLDGQVMAKLELRLTKGGTHLEGKFVPQKVEFTHQPPRVTTSYFLAPQPRAYRRVIPVPAEEPVEVWGEELTPEQAEAG